MEPRLVLVRGSGGAVALSVGPVGLLMDAALCVFVLLPRRGGAADREDGGAAERPGAAGCWKEPGWSWSHVQGSARPRGSRARPPGAGESVALIQTQERPRTDVRPRAKGRTRRNAASGSEVTHGSEGSGRPAVAASQPFFFSSETPPPVPPPLPPRLCVLQVLLFEFENFQGCKAEFSSDCKDVTEKGLQKVGSIVVQSGP